MINSSESQRRLIQEIDLIYVSLMHTNDMPSLAGIATR